MRWRKIYIWGAKKIVLSLAKNFSKGIYDAFANWIRETFWFFVETGCLSRYEQSFLIKTRARLKMITRLKTILIEWSQELKDFFGRIRKHLSKHDKKIIRRRGSAYYLEEFEGIIQQYLLRLRRIIVKYFKNLRKWFNRYWKWDGIGVHAWGEKIPSRLDKRTILS